MIIAWRSQAKMASGCTHTLGARLDDDKNEISDSLFFVRHTGENRPAQTTSPTAPVVTSVHRL
jgi:hypothetical protein